MLIREPGWGEISAFQDSNGVSIFSEQVLTIYGNGEETKLVFTASDTVGEVADKIHEAISFGLNMGSSWASSVKPPQLVRINSEAMPSMPLLGRPGR